MRVLLTGAHGFIGQALGRRLAHRHDIRICQQSSLPLSFPVSQTFTWSPSNLEQAVSEVDAIIHLSGATFNQLDTPLSRYAVWASRVKTTQALVSACQKKSVSPIWISISGVHRYAFYDSPQSEEQPAGSHFLGRLCEAWEQASLNLPPESRRVILRLGVVLDLQGGLLPLYLNLLSQGIYLPINQIRLDWIILEDLLNIIENILVNTKWRGVYNIHATTPLQMPLPSRKVFKVPLSLIRYNLTLNRLLMRPTYSSSQKLQKLYTPKYQDSLNWIHQKMPSYHFSFVQLGKYQTERQPSSSWLHSWKLRKMGFEVQIHLQDKEISIRISLLNLWHYEEKFQLIEKTKTEMIWRRGKSLWKWEFLKGYQEPTERVSFYFRPFVKHFLLSCIIRRVLYKMHQERLTS